jgi:hypothetical protein
MSKQDSINKIRMLIRTKIANLNEVAYPNILNRIKTEQGYKHVEEQVIRYASKNDVSLDNAIAHLEMEL